MKRIPTRIIYLYNSINSFQNINPYTIIYFYPKDVTPFVVKGGLEDCNRFVVAYKNPAILHYTFWRHGNHRGYHMIINTRIKCFLQRIKEGYKYFYELSTNRNFLKRIKRVPRKWMKELNDFI